MIPWYLANFVIGLQTVNRIALSSGFEINSTVFFADVIQKLDLEQERAEATANKQANKLRSLLEEFNQSNAENAAAFRRQLSDLSAALRKAQEKQETPRDILDEENSFSKELREYIRQVLQQNLKLSDAAQRVESKLTKLEHTLYRTELSTHLLLESSRADLGEPLLSAVKSGDVERVLLLLEVGAPIEYEDSKKNRPIHIAVENNRPRILEILLDNKADIESHGENQMTALHLAGYTKCTGCTRILIDKGVDLESRDQWGNTPIIHAASSGFDDFIELLVDNGANINAVNLDGMSGLHRAAQGGRLSTVKLLLRKGVNPRLRTLDGRIAYDIVDYFKHRPVYDILNKAK